MLDSKERNEDYLRRGLDGILGCALHSWNRGWLWRDGQEQASMKMYGCEGGNLGLSSDLVAQREKHLFIGIHFFSNKIFVC